jgi:hypothetical protein
MPSHCIKRTLGGPESFPLLYFFLHPHCCDAKPRCLFRFVNASDEADRRGKVAIRSPAVKVGQKPPATPKGHDSPVRRAAFSPTTSASSPFAWHRLAGALIDIGPPQVYFLSLLAVSIGVELRHSLLRFSIAKSAWFFVRNERSAYPAIHTISEGA